MIAGLLLAVGCALAGSVAVLLEGILVFHDPIGLGPSQIAARVAAFGPVILGAALLPGPLRAGASTAADNTPITAAGVAMLDQAGV